MIPLQNISQLPYGSCVTSVQHLGFLSPIEIFYYLLLNVYDLVSHDNHVRIVTFQVLTGKLLFQHLIA